MANQIATIPVLESILEKRYHSTSNGRVQIGVFWSILQIYYCMRTVGVSPRVLCAIASMVEGRVDHNYLPTSAPINQETLRRWLHLKTVPKNISHSTITKTISRGVTPTDRISSILKKYNSYGDGIMSEIAEAIETKGGAFVSSQSSTQGVSDFSAVLSTSVAIIDAYRDGALTLQDVPSEDVMEVIIKSLNKNNNNNEQSEIGVRL